MKRVIWCLLSAVLATSCVSTEDCEVRTCGEDLADGFDTNGKSYQRCFSGGTTITTTLVGDDGDVFFECTDQPGRTCTEASVDAQFAYCGL